MLLSFVTRRKFWFRNVKTARMTFERAEIHNRPNTGLPVEEMASLLEAHGLQVDIVRSPDERLEPKGWMSWQEMILHAASGHNPFSAKYGWFTLVARHSD